MLEGVFFALYYHTSLCRDTINAVSQQEVEALVSEDNNRDLDAQFRDLVADMESDLEGDLPQGAGENASPTRDALDTPVDESLHLEGGKLSVALVLAPRPSIHCSPFPVFTRPWCV